MRWLYLSWNFSPRVMVKLAGRDRVPLTRALHRELISQFPTKQARAGLWGFVRSLLDEGGSLGPELGWLLAAKVPTTVVWGRAAGLTALDADESSSACSGSTLR